MTKSESARSAPEAGRTASSKKRTQDIIDTAAEIFHEQGYSETSVHDIAEAVGILKGSLYYYIRSKEDLLFQVLSDVHDAFKGIVERSKALDAPAVERLRYYIREHVIFNTQNVTKMAVFYHDYRALSEKPLAEIIERRRFYEDYLRGLIAEAQADGSVNPDLEPKLAVFTLFGMMNWVYHWYKPTGPWTPEQIGEQVASMAIDGLVGPRAARRATGAKKAVAPAADASGGRAPRRRRAAKA
jgi:TetR/AcrR family transcriptional regulator, cholesterol catabolism regulator